MTLAIGEDDVEIITINGIQYRKAKIKRLVDSNRNEMRRQNEEESLRDETSDTNTNTNVVQFEGGSFTLKMKIAPIFFKFLIGKRGATKERLQKETGATILIPSKQNSSSEEVIIRGPTENAIENARTRIEIILESAKKKMEPTHFLSIPLNAPEIQSKLEAFFKELKEKFYDNEANRPLGFDPSIIINPKTFHLTIVMLKLFTNEEIERVVNFMKKISQQVYDMLETRSLLLKLQGLEIMNDDPSAVDILYLKVQEVGGNRLERLCQFLVESLEKEELIDKQAHQVKLHATLLNTRHRQNEPEDQKTESRNDTKQKTNEFTKRISFDARKILQTYGSINIADQYKIESLQLSQRHVYDTNGYYHCVYEIRLP
jgi:activating signal cointegrator complex subunit 1